MALLCFLVLLILPSRLFASNQTCTDTDVEGDEISALQKIKRVKPPEASYIPHFPISAITTNGYFKPTTVNGKHVFGGKKVFISKNSCSTVLWCLQTAYAVSGIGPGAHGLCKAYNIDLTEGCSLWMQTFMNQLALTLGSSSLNLNLFLDFNSGAIKKCLTPTYNQACVDNALNAAVEEADVFIYFPGYYCGPSCVTEVEKAKDKARRVPAFTVIEMPFANYYNAFKGLDKAEIPSVLDPPGESFLERQGGATAATLFLKEIEKKLGMAAHSCYPAGECIIGDSERHKCCSGHSEHNGFGDRCLRNFGQGLKTPEQCLPR